MTRVFATFLFESAPPHQLMVKNISHLLCLVCLVSFHSNMPGRDSDPVTTLPVYQVEGRALLAENQLSVDTGWSSILHEEDWKRIGAADLAGALRRVPGVTVSRYNVVGSYGGADGGAVFIRGHGSSRPGSDISILYDGIPRVVGVWTHPLLDTISIDMASSLEIHKTPQPVTLGNMAFGAINVVPKQQTPDATILNVRGSYGNWSTSMFAASLGYADTSSDILAAVAHRKSDGHREDASGKTESFFVNAGHQLTERLKLRYTNQFTRSDAQDPRPVGSFLPITESFESSNAFHLLKAELETDPFQVEAKAYLEQGTIHWLQWDARAAQSSVTRTDSRNSGAHLRVFSENQEGINWQGGLHLDRIGGSTDTTLENGAVTRFDRITFETLAPFAMLNREFSVVTANDLSIGAGVRGFFHNTFDNEWGYQANLTHSMQSLTTMLHYARAVNYPGVYVSVFGRRPPPWNLGEDWKNLEAETVDSVEAALLWQPSSAWSIGLSVFHNRVRNSLRIVAPPPAGYIRNFDSHTLKGIEVSAMGRLLENLFGSAALTLMGSDPTMPNIPKWNVQSSLVWQALNNLELSLGYQHTAGQWVLNPRFGEDAVRVSGFHLLDASAIYRMPDQIAKGMSLFANVENLTNTHYAYRPGYPMPGIFFSVGAEWRW